MIVSENSTTSSSSSFSSSSSSSLFSEPDNHLDNLTPVVGDNNDLTNFPVEEELLVCSWRWFKKSRWWNTKDWWSVWIGFFLFGLISGLAGYGYNTPAMHGWSSDPKEMFDNTSVYLPLLWLTMLLTCWLAIYSIRGSGKVPGYDKFPYGFTIIWIGTFFSYFIGKNKAISDIGLGPAIWAILIGFVLSNIFWPKKSLAPNWIKVASQTGLYISISLVLLCVDIVTVENILGRSIGTAWIDTPILFITLSISGVYVLGLPTHLSIIITGATTICGTSAAIALATVVAQDPSDVDIPIAIVALLTVPAIVGLPYLADGLNYTQGAAGAFFGGCVDSTGGVLATSSLFGGRLTTDSSAIVKMLQNLLIAPIAIGTTFFWVWYEKKLDRKNSQSINETTILLKNDENLNEDNEALEAQKPTEKSWGEWLGLVWQYTPKFVLGFVCVVIFFNTFIPGDQRDNTFDQLFNVSEWFSTASFVSIGLNIRIRDIIKPDKAKLTLILTVQYLIVQILDIIVTGGLSWLFFVTIKGAITSE